ncbi:helix-turn-helix domain-containing protein [Defluviimonas sp. WL0002]|uniref:Helix-turn-helix domain-containing protein n=1 Tax=Albidovulum marisflavi TaxID=2984159 RepID=A0ABT2ZCJ3_9RHOB|nr:helix-turn-helix transcriptional regulator [Defluviimonas sp. WL0002]MCV2868868.1 helix-turn-helix domain-containing protein [Defluviimonas sp. WL0002]
MSEFAVNLSSLCARHRSIAEVCRRIGINRQQFNKYLAGQAHPSRHNMRRLCGFFGVSESEILLPASRFDALIALRDQPLDATALEGPLRHLDRLYARSNPMDKYAGFYFRYFFSFGNKGQIIRSLAAITIEHGHAYWKNIELLRDPVSGRRGGVNKYEGTAFQLSDRIYVMEYETLQMHSITQMTLYPSYQQRLDVLMGIQTGGPTRRGRKPGASRVALEFLGRDVNVRRALRQTGLFSPGDPSLRQEIVHAIRNSIAEGDYVLEVDAP